MTDTAELGHKRRILVADDDEDLRIMIRERLVRENYEVIEAQNGLELLDALTCGDHFDLVVSDVRMPWVSGLQVATAVRRSGSVVPCLIMSAFGDESLRADIAALPAAEFIEKPFSLLSLCERIQRTLADARP